MFAGGGRSLHVTFDDAFVSVSRIVPLLEELGLAAACTIFACADYARDGRPLDVPELAADARAHPAELATLPLAELRDLAERGIEIGSHTSTHPHLTRLTQRELELELRESHERLEEGLDRRCRFLAYPYGEHDERVRTAARAVGYEAAFALGRRDGALDRFAFPRVGIYRRDGRFRARLKTSRLVRAAAS